MATVCVVPFVIVAHPPSAANVSNDHPRICIPQAPIPKIVSNRCVCDKSDPVGPGSAARLGMTGGSLSLLRARAKPFSFARVRVAWGSIKLRKLAGYRDLLRAIRPLVSQGGMSALSLPRELINGQRRRAYFVRFRSKSGGQRCGTGRREVQ